MAIHGQNQRIPIFGKQISVTKWANTLNSNSKQYLIYILTFDAYKTWQSLAKNSNECDFEMWFVATHLTKVIIFCAEKWF